MLALPLLDLPLAGYERFCLWCLRLVVLGHHAVHAREPRPERFDRVVLAALTVSLGEVVAVATLVEAMWGERPPASATKVVHGCVLRLRRSLGSLAIVDVDRLTGTTRTIARLDGTVTGPRPGPA